MSRISGSSGDAGKAKEILYTMNTGNYGFEGMCLAENLDKLAGMDIIKETPTLSQICIAVMKAHSKLG